MSESGIRKAFKAKEENPLKPFMDQDFLLENDVAKKLYHEYAENMPIYDYHCHISPCMIYENYQFQNIGIDARRRPLQVARHALQRRG